jgi:hypothetical protein
MQACVRAGWLPCLLASLAGRRQDAWCGTLDGVACWLPHLDMRASLMGCSLVGVIL